MNTNRAEALSRFEGFYAELELALDERDTDRVAVLVEGRASALDRLIRVFEGEPLPDAAKLRVEFAESRIRERMIALHAEIMRELAESRRRQSASNRYAQAAR